MKICPSQTAALTFAATQGLPYAFWRTPGEAHFKLLISTTTPELAKVFDGENLPSFVAAPFRSEDGNRAWRLLGDVVITPERTQFRNGAQLVDTPVTNLQANIAKGMARLPLQAQKTEGNNPTSREDYKASVQRTVSYINEGHCEKIVLSRIEPRPLEPDYDLVTLAEKLAAAHPHALVTVFSSEPTGTWLVATPEILLTADSDSLTTMALAGTQWPPEGTDLSSIEWSEKIIHEQALVSDFIRAAFAAEGVQNLDETAAATVQAANLCHLRSDFKAPSVQSETLAGLLRRLHPTSAVCGMPKPEAHAFILSEEGDTRGLYAGYFGPASFDGRTELYVNLRSARVAGHEIFLHVGGGIVGASDPDLEWDETVAKTKTIACVL